MKKFLSVVVAALILSSCATYEGGCPSYGNTNKMTKYGSKAQSRYTKRHI